MHAEPSRRRPVLDEPLPRAGRARRAAARRRASTSSSTCTAWCPARTSCHWTESARRSCSSRYPPPDDAWHSRAASRQRLTFDLENPTSIMSCVSRARNNARSIRGSINSEMWTELNKLYWQLCDAEFRAQAHESPHEFYQAVDAGSQLFQGVCDATLTTTKAGSSSSSASTWSGPTRRCAFSTSVSPDRGGVERRRGSAAVEPAVGRACCKSCRAYEAYQRLYVGRVEPERVVEFLLLHPTMPAVGALQPGSRRAVARSRRGARRGRAKAGAAPRSRAQRPEVHASSSRCCARICTDSWRTCSGAAPGRPQRPGTLFAALRGGGS